jgi:hypothetical protein
MTHNPEVPGHSNGLCVGGRYLPAVEVAAPAPAIRLGAELALKLHEAPHLSAIRADVWLDVGGQLADGRQVDLVAYLAM